MYNKRVPFFMSSHTESFILPGCSILDNSLPGIERIRNPASTNEAASTKNIYLAPSHKAIIPASPGPNTPSNCQVAFDKDIAIA